MSGKGLGLAGMLVFFWAQSASAGGISDPVPDELTILHDGLRWAWASPVATEYFSTNDLQPPEYHPGWRYATAEEWQSRPLASDFLRIPGDTESVRNATAYWNTAYDFVNYNDAAIGNVTSVHQTEGLKIYWDTWYVSDLAPSSVPEPATLLLWALAGSVGMIYARWQCRKPN